MLGENAAVLSDPEKRLSRVYRRIRNPEFVGGETVRREAENAG
jgi:hypothetical protein